MTMHASRPRAVTLRMWATGDTSDLACLVEMNSALTVQLNLLKRVDKAFAQPPPRPFSREPPTKVRKNGLTKGLPRDHDEGFWEEWYLFDIFILSTFRWGMTTTKQYPLVRVLGLFAKKPTGHYQILCHNKHDTVRLP